MGRELVKKDGGAQARLAARQYKADWERLGFTRVSIFVPNEQEAAVKAYVDKIVGETLLSIVESADLEAMILMAHKQVRRVPSIGDVSSLLKQIETKKSLSKRGEALREKAVDYHHYRKVVEAEEVEDEAQLAHAYAMTYALGHWIRGEYFQLAEKA